MLMADCFGKKYKRMLILNAIIHILLMSKKLTTVIWYVQVNYGIKMEHGTISLTLGWSE